MSEVPTSVQNITPVCRANRTNIGALSEALARIQQAYVRYVDSPGNEGVTWRVSLVRVEDDGL